MSVGHSTSGGVRFVRWFKRLFRLKISAKIFLYFVVIALVPLVTVSSVLVIAAREQLLQDASTKQQAVATDLSRRVDNYIANDVNQLTLMARLYSSHDFVSTTQLDQSLSALFNQNASLQEITLLTANGHQYRLTGSSGNVDISNTDLSLPNSQAIDYLANKPYFISVGRYGQENFPQATIAIPVLQSYGAPDNSLYAAPSGPLKDITGAIVAQYNIQDMWQSVLSANIGNGGYAYAVESHGILVAHPNAGFLSSHTSLADTEAVHQFLTSKSATRQTISETGVEVISTPQKTSSGLAVIVEEPVSSIYAGIDSYIRLSATVGISAIILSILIGIFFSRQLIRPIRELTLGAKRLGLGDFDQTINIKTHDEFHELAETFNQMGSGIKKLIGDLRTNNLRLKFEQIKLNNIISSVSDGIVAVNNRGEIVTVNPPAAALIGKRPAELEGKLMSDEFAWEHDGQSFEPDLKMGGIYRYTDLILSRGDSLIYLDMMVAVLAHQESDVAAIITIHDQTESRELSFMKLDFVAIAAHELRTPLTIVRGYLDMLSTSAAHELSVLNLENLSKAIAGANQLRELINKLLNIARIERGDMELSLEKLNFSQTVKENADQHVSMAGQKEQHLTYTTNAKNDVYVPADAASVAEVLNNLIGNAIKYTPKGGNITVELIAEGDEARVEVTDNGPGIPDELRDKLFTKFYRAERSMIAGTRGTGLGLFISKTIIELQNGKIGIEPNSGKGSTFYFSLPIYNSERDDELITKKTSGGIRGWFKKHASR